MKIKFYPHQKTALDTTKELNHVAYYHDMGLGKTFTGAEKMIQLSAPINLVICQKSKIEDWAEHFKRYYSLPVYNLTDKKDYERFFEMSELVHGIIGVINYELAFRRPELSQLENFTLMLDESSLIQNENAKRSKFILKKLKPKNVILLSGTPTGGKYEKLWSQLHLLGWPISKELYIQQYIDIEFMENMGYSIPIVVGYKNVDRLKQKMAQYGCQFLRTDEVFDLPKQIFNIINVNTTKEYRKFKKSSIITMNDKEFVGDTSLTKMLYERMLCGSYNIEKLNAFRDLVESTNDRLIVYYNFNDELQAIQNIVQDYTTHLSLVNGKVKDLTSYEAYDDSITFIQYQAGAMGLNLQKANKIIYFSPPIMSVFYEQSKKRIHRIGQDRPCFYYNLICKNSIEERVYQTLEMRKDYTEALFRKDEE